MTEHRAERDQAPRGERTRDPAEQAELERLTGRPTVDVPADAPEVGDDIPYPSADHEERR